MYGPKGVGALWVRRKPRVRIDPLIDGGGHERGMRSGTLAVPLIVGFGKAAELAQGRDGRRGHPARRAARRGCYRGIRSKLTETYVNGSLEHRLPGNLNISFAFVEGESLLMALKDVAVSSGSACTSASLEPSYVLRALGVGDELAHTSIRFGIGRFNTEEEIDYVIDIVVKSVERLRDAVAALGDAPGRHRHQLHPVDPALTGKKHHGVLRQSHRALREPPQRRHLRQGGATTSAPASSARPPAAT